MHVSETEITNILLITYSISKFWKSASTVLEIFEKLSTFLPPYLPTASRIKNTDRLISAVLHACKFLHHTLNSPCIICSLFFVYLNSKIPAVGGMVVMPFCTLSCARTSGKYVFQLYLFRLVRKKTHSIQFVNACCSMLWHGNWRFNSTLRIY